MFNSGMQIISTTEYLSFLDLGIMLELQTTNNFVPGYKLIEKIRREERNPKKQALEAAEREKTRPLKEAEKRVEKEKLKAAEKKAAAEKELSTRPRRFHC